VTVGFAQGAHFWCVTPDGNCAPKRVEPGAAACTHSVLLPAVRFCKLISVVSPPGRLLHLDTERQAPPAAQHKSRQPCRFLWHLQVHCLLRLLQTTWHAQLTSHAQLTLACCGSVWKTPTKQWSASKSRDSFSTGGSSDSSSKGSGSREQSHFREEELNDASFARDWEPGHHEEHISQKPYHQDNVAQKQGKSCAYVGTSELTSALEGLGVNSHGISDTRGDFPVENGSASAAGASPELKLPSGPILSPHRQSAIRFPHRQSAFEAVMLQQKLYEEMMRQEHGTNRHTQRHLSPPPREISQAPSQGLVTQQIASDPEISPPPRDISQAPSQGRANQQIVSGPEMHAGEGIHVPSLGLVICNKYVSIVSSGASPPGRLHRESPAEMTVGLVHIKKILPHSPASRCDAIAAGDEILAVNSFCCRGRTLEEIALFMTPTTHLHELFGPTQPAKPVHIISRRFSGASRGGLRQESLCHASIVPDDPFHPDSLAELSYDKRCGDMIEDSGNLCASLGAVEEAVFDKVLTSREKGLISRPAAPVGSVRKDGYITTWRSFPMMSLSVMTLPGGHVFEQSVECH